MTSSLRIGAIEVTVLADGTDAVPPAMILDGMPAERSSAVVAGHLDADGLLPVACTGLLIRSAGRTVLVDAGYGDWAESEASGGRLGRSLAAAGVASMDVDEVIVSHGHVDHIGGLTHDDRGARVPVYRAATHWWADREWAHWTAEDTLADLPGELADPARASLPPLAAAGLVRLFDREREIAPGVFVTPAPGHTPGHAVVAIVSDGQRAVAVGDAVFHPLNVTHPGWSCAFDVDPAAAVRSRLHLLDQVASDGSIVLGAHLAVAGRVERAPDGYRFVPLSPPPVDPGEAAGS